MLVALLSDLGLGTDDRSPLQDIGGMNMIFVRLSKLILALAVIGASCAALASSALAGIAVTEPAAWVTTIGGGLKGTLIEEDGPICGQTDEAEPFVLKSKVLGSTLELTATGINCNGATLKTVNPGFTAAILEGQLEFTGVSVMLPAGCSTPGILKTNTIVGELTMGSGTFLKIASAAGESAAIANVKLEGCAAAGTYPLKGNIYFDNTAETGEHAFVQEFAGNETTQSMSSLKFGNEPATLSGEFGIELELGYSWGAERP